MDEDLEHMAYNLRRYHAQDPEDWKEMYAIFIRMQEKILQEHNLLQIQKILSSHEKYKEKPEKHFIYNIILFFQLIQEKLYKIANTLLDFIRCSKINEEKTSRSIFYKSLH